MVRSEDTNGPMWFSTRSFPLVAAAETTSNNALPGTWLASSIKTCQGAAHSVTAPANNSNLLQGLDEQLMQWHRQNGVLVLTKRQQIPSYSSVPWISKRISLVYKRPGEGQQIDLGLEGSMQLCLVFP